MFIALISDFDQTLSPPHIIIKKGINIKLKYCTTKTKNSQENKVKGGGVCGKIDRQQTINRRTVVKMCLQRIRLLFPT